MSLLWFAGSPPNAAALEAAKNLIQCWKECMATSSYTLRKAAVEKFNSENYWKKKGLAMVPLKFPVGVGSVAAGQVSSSHR